jgi:hypothetical protein
MFQIEPIDLVDNYRLILYYVMQQLLPIISRKSDDVEQRFSTFQDHRQTQKMSYL